LLSHTNYFIYFNWQNVECVRQGLHGGDTTDTGLSLQAIILADELMAVGTKVVYVLKVVDTERNEAATRPTTKEADGSSRYPSKRSRREFSSGDTLYTAPLANMCFRPWPKGSVVVMVMVLRRRLLVCLWLLLFHLGLLRRIVACRLEPLLLAAIALLVGREEMGFIVIHLFCLSYDTCFVRY